MGWLIVSGIVLLAAVLAVILWARQLAKHSFRCKACAREFRVSWRRLIFTTHSYDEYSLRCPHCGSKGCTEQNISDKA